MAKCAKGVSGNPGGRPSGVGDLRELARTHTGEAVQVLVQVMGDASAAPTATVTSILSDGPSVTVPRTKLPTTPK